MTGRWYLTEEDTQDCAMHEGGKVGSELSEDGDAGMRALRRKR